MGKMKKRNVAKIMAAQVLGLALLSQSVPAHAMNATALISDATTTTKALQDLQAVVKAAKRVNLKDYPAPYADNVKYALSMVSNITPNSTVYKINETRLTLQVALDALAIDLEKSTIADMQAAVKAGTLTYEKLVQMYLARIDLYNNYTVKLDAVASINPNALALAKASDAAVKADPSKAAGMFGIPILIKDNIGTAAADGMPTTAGSIALANNYPQDDSFLSGKLKASGAIILGKTNLSEFANFITSGMRSGYSTLQGQVLNPYLPGVIDVSGSSSGSGAGGAAALAAITIGTETSGSILSPSQRNSLVGLKPTVGLVSRSGIIPLSHSQDTAGPMGRDVADVATLLTAMQGYDSGDLHINMGVDNEVVVDEAYFKAHVETYTDYLKTDGLKGKVLGVYRTPNKETQPDVYAAFEKAVQVLKDQGATIVYGAGGKDMADELPSAPASKVLYYDFKEDIENYLKAQKNPILASDNKTVIASLKDIVDYNKKHLDVLKYGQTILEEVLGYDMTPGSADYKKSQEQRAADIAYARKNGLNKLLDTYKLDGLIGLNGATTGIAAKAGYPSITVPTGYRTAEGGNGEPINLQITGDAFTEEKLIEMGYAYEQATHARVAPGMAVKDRLKTLLDDAAANALGGGVYADSLSVYNSNFSTPREVNDAANRLYLELYRSWWSGLSKELK
ncbi:amidase family protein [Cohnella sp. JJ-181]|uniref:amidase family protein n=1 Tax=Cohnella rhizoplanae TaxID=2974897 RepID=UPI0022FFB5C0|nr:amidase family protein [Cohnella sp. JJ-181]CAI6060617.1 Glutamyl-tRNA(Gln) amidotransferase subunit A, chloroplastic/mitochondrial [Cohnella sp. JJ-181]